MTSALYDLRSQVFRSTTQCIGTSTEGNAVYMSVVLSVSGARHSPAYEPLGKTKVSDFNVASAVQ